MNRTIKIEFKPDEYVEEILRKNCEYRHFLYNKGIELLKHQAWINDDGNWYFIGYSKYDLNHDLYRLYEQTSLNRPDYLEDYAYYFRGIRAEVTADISQTYETVKTNRSKGESADLHFISYNPNKLSFKFENKVHREKKKKPDGLYQGNSIILTENPWLIGVKVNNTQPPLGITLCEPITRFNLDLNEVREIAFKFHNEKWYLCLIYRDEKDYKKLVDIKYKKREYLAGIDLGEINPVIIYDGRRIKKIPKHLEFPKERVIKVENRIKRLQSVMDKKYNSGMDRFHQSKNYYKVLKKFHKAWEHMVNIKKDWHFKLAHWIVTHYKNIVVDEFKDHIIPINSSYNSKVRKRYNHSMYRRSMYEFTQRLIHMSRKYGTNYFNPDESIETTNTCNRCGNVNQIKLILDERIFKCESCNYTIDRDDNASINCYKAFMNNQVVPITL